MKEFWDARYAQETYVYGKEPNIYFKETLSLLNQGKFYSLQREKGEMQYMPPLWVGKFLHMTLANLPTKKP
jgi:hypothetical protein